MKYRGVWGVENSTIRDVSNDIRANLSPSMVWFDDELDGSWWTCNTLNESHHNEKGLKVV